MKFDKLEIGDTYFTVTKRKMGNTTISTISIHPVKVIDIDTEREIVTASWNGNSPRKFGYSAYSKWKKTKPMTITNSFGAARLATREEIKASKLILDVIK